MIQVPEKGLKINQPKNSRDSIVINCMLYLRIESSCFDTDSAKSIPAAATHNVRANAIIGIFGESNYGYELPGSRTVLMSTQ